MTNYIITFIVSAFVAYLIGRVSHKYFNVWLGDPVFIPHHWIPGVIMIVIGVYYYQTFLGLLLMSFGLGMVISDFDDFIHLRTFSKDGPGPKRFWHID